MWRHHGPALTVLIIMAAFLLSGCGADMIRVGPLQSSTDTGMGYVAADEPRAVMAGRDMLTQGGSAADAAVATAMSLSVTLQSSAGLGGGGMCLVYDASRQVSEVIDFSPEPAVGREDMARWQSAVPTLPRGLFALHAKYGTLAWQTVVSPAESVARFGHTVSRQLAADLLRHSDVLVNDPRALDTFMSPRRTLVTEGDIIDQHALSAMLAQLRGRTPADFYSGVTAQQLHAQAELAGLSLTASDLRVYAPVWREADFKDVAGTRIYVATDKNLATNVMTALDGQVDGATHSGDHIDAGATGFVVHDGRGNAVACSLTMLRPFGLGVKPAGAGFLMAPSPTVAGAASASMIAVIGINARSAAFQFAAASGGQDSHRSVVSFIGRTLQRSAEASPQSLRQRGQRPYVNRIVCENGNPRRSQCAVTNDPAGFGYGVVAELER